MDLAYAALPRRRSYQIVQGLARCVPLVIGEIIQTQYPTEVVPVTGYGGLEFLGKLEYHCLHVAALGVELLDVGALLAQVQKSWNPFICALRDDSKAAMWPMASRSIY